MDRGSGCSRDTAFLTKNLRDRGKLASKINGNTYEFILHFNIIFLVALTFNFPLVAHIDIMKEARPAYGPWSHGSASPTLGLTINTNQ